MKKYVSPELEALNFVVEEGIMTDIASGDPTDPGRNNDTPYPW